MHVMIKPASGLCNMACAYCFYCDEASSRAQASYGMMSEETLRDVIRKTIAHADGQITYAFQGGEPSLRGLDFYRKAVELQAHYNRNGVEVQNAFQTNGYTIDAEWCRFFAEHHFLVGLSVDGVRETHDRFRKDPAGRGTYDRALQTAALMDRYGVEYNILTVLHSETAAHIEEIYEDYRRRGWRYQQYILCLDPLEAGHAQEYSLSPEAYGRCLTRLFDLWYRDVKRGRAPYIRQFDNYVGILKGFAPESCDMRGRCQAQCIVEADGSVYPCDFYALDPWRLGSYTTDSFRQIAESPVIRTFEARSLEADPKCRECPHAGLCRGGCQRQKDRVGNDYVNHYCEGYRYFFEHCTERLRELAAW